VAALRQEANSTEMVRRLYSHDLQCLFRSASACQMWCLFRRELEVLFFNLDTSSTPLLGYKAAVVVKWRSMAVLTPPEEP